MLLNSFIDLHEGFNDEYGIGTNLLSYLARPRMQIKGFKFSECYDDLLHRRPKWGPDLHYAGQDRNILKVRYDLISNNNRAYVIAVKEDPSVADLEEFSYIKPCWSTLFPIKLYLCHHLDKAFDYKGLQPFGSFVIHFMNKLSSIDDVGSNPDLRDHIRLKNLTDKYSKLLGVSSTVVNTLMYLEGRTAAQTADSGTVRVP